jgi:hypothetical protein
VLQEALYIRGTEHLFFDSFLHRSAENFLTVTLQDVVQPIDVVEPLPRSAMNDLGEVEESRLTKHTGSKSAGTLSSEPAYRRVEERQFTNARHHEIGNPRALPPSSSLRGHSLMTPRRLDNSRNPLMKLVSAKSKGL